MKTCGTCNLCCKVSAIKALQKPAGQWCIHTGPGRGCAIHGRHPDECRIFRCGWLQIDALEPNWKPEISKFVLRIDKDGQNIHVAVDQGHPDAWRKAPYYRTLKAWSRDASVMVYLGERGTVVLPEEDIEIGETGAGDVIRMGYRDLGVFRQPWVTVTPVAGAVREYAGGRYAKT